MIGGDVDRHPLYILTKLTTGSRLKEKDYSK